MNPIAASSADDSRYPLNGVVWVSPTCAGAQREGDLCRGPLPDVEVRLSDDSGRVVIAAKSSATGAFTMLAPAGRYRLYVANLARVPRCAELAVTLPMTNPKKVELECDSGMR